MTIKQFIIKYVTPSPKWLLACQGVITGVMITGIFITLIHNIYKGDTLDWSYVSSQLVGILLVNSNTILLEIEKILND